MGKTVEGLETMSLAELLASIVQRIIDDKSNVPQCRKDLTTWYRAQTPEDPVAFAKTFRESMEIFKHVSEAMFSMSLEMTAGMR